MQYSPKLKMAMEEIKEILKKHDIAASVVLHTPGWAEYLLRIDPSYSCATLSEKGIRVKAKAEDFGGNVDLLGEVLTNTANMLHNLHTVGLHNSTALGEVSKQVDQLLESQHLDGGHTSHRQQNN